MSKEILLYEESIISENTDIQDIAKTEPNLAAVATPAVSQTIPQMISYVQNINAPQGFIFGVVPRAKTSINNPDYPATPSQPAAPDTPDDLIITRTSVNTNERNVVISFTNEVEQDIMNLFDPNDSSMNYFGRDEKVSQFFLDYGNYRINKKTDDDFMTWLGLKATNKGSTTISTYAEMDKILGIIGELKEALFRQSGKQSRTWIIVSPRVAAYLATINNFVNHNDSVWFNNGRKHPDTSINPYVGSFGDTDVFMYNSNVLPGGSTGTTETTGFIYMGLLGGPGTASIFYTPYKRYILKTGSDVDTGQSALIFKMRDSWSLNPQDTKDQAMSGTDIPNTDGISKFVVSSSITFSESLIN